MAWTTRPITRQPFNVSECSTIMSIYQTRAPSRAMAGAAAFFVAVSAPFHAASAQEAASRESKDVISVAGGVAYGPSYEGSDDYRALPSLQVRGSVSGYAFVTRGLQLEVDAIREAPDESIDVSFGPVLGVRLNRVSGIKDRQVRALGKKDVAVELGAYAGIAKRGVLTSDFDSLALRVSYVTDVAGAHGSYVISPAVEYFMPLSRATAIGASLSTDYVGDGYARYYYSVDAPGAAASGLSQFEAKGGFRNVSLGVLGIHSLSGDLRKGWSLFAIGNYGRLLGDFKRSPVTSEAGSANQWFGALGAAYTF